MPGFKLIFIGLILNISSYLLASDNIIQKYEEIVHLDESGDLTVHLKVNVSESNSGYVRLPMPFANAEVVSLKAEWSDEQGLSGEVPVRFSTAGNPPVVETGVLAEGWKNLDLEIILSIPQYYNFRATEPGEFGLYDWTYSFSNTSDFLIKDYRLTLILPADYNFNNVTGSIPKFTKKTPEPPYQFNSSDDLNRITLNGGSLAFGKSASVSVLFKAEEKSLWIFGIGIVLIGLYLIFFREMWLKRNKIDD